MTPACACLQDFLKERGIVVDSTTVIQQAAVTGLSDSNSESLHSLRHTSLALPGLVSYTISLSAAARGVLCSARSHFFATLSVQVWLRSIAIPRLQGEVLTNKTQVPPW